ncbi:MAG: methyltransferase [Candidatus Methanoperedens sp.]|nr:methyltransferase [Candidatus Methanoperedens sp.]MCZ7371785.1 methyltransferase [Candidatus Methanoperedens sp.]
MPTGKDFDFERAGDDARELILLGAAYKAGIFSALAESKDISALKQELRADERALHIVLEALCSLGYVNKENSRYIIADKARPLFLERGEDYVGGYLPHLMDILGTWLKLPDIIKGIKSEKSTPRDVPSFMHAMASKPDAFVDEVISHCLARKRDAKYALDLGGGPGKYAKAFINKGLEAVLYDMPETIDYVGKEFGLSKIRNLTLKKGDFTDSEFVKDFKAGSFDIVFMGNICHIYSEEENRKLVRNVRVLLKRGGLIAIEDFVRGRSPRAELFGVNMLAHTEEGNTWTEEQYRAWLEDAGLHSIEVVDLDERESQLITGIR